MSKDTSYEAEQETPLVVWSRYAAYDKLQHRLADLFGFLARNELAMKDLTQLRVGVHVRRRGLMACVATLAYTPNPATSADVNFYRRACEEVVELQARTDFTEVKLELVVFHGNMNNPYAKYVLCLTSDHSISVELHNCINPEFSSQPVSVGRMTTKDSWELLNFLLIELMYGTVLSSRLACMSAVKKAFTAVTL